jgi:hypothetical protein
VQRNHRLDFFFGMAKSLRPSPFCGRRGGSRAADFRFAPLGLALNGGAVVYQRALDPPMCVSSRRLPRSASAGLLLLGINSSLAALVQAIAQDADILISIRIFWAIVWVCIFAVLVSGDLLWHGRAALEASSGLRKTSARTSRGSHWRAPRHSGSPALKPASIRAALLLEPERPVTLSASFVSGSRA